MKLNQIEGETNFVPAFCEEHGLVQLTQAEYEQGPDGWRCPISGCGRKVVPQSVGSITFAQC